MAAVLNLLINLRIASKKALPMELWDLIYPHDKGGLPKFSDKGRYQVRVFHQDEWKLLVVDDRIPVDASGKSLYPYSPNPLEIWPQLLAKALNKLFPGEEWMDGGATVVYTLTGHIASSLPTQPTDLMIQANYTWKELLFKQTDDNEAVCGFLTSDEPVMWPEGPLTSTLPVQHPLRLADSVEVRVEAPAGEVMSDGATDAKDAKVAAPRVAPSAKDAKQPAPKAPELPKVLQAATVKVAETMVDSPRPVEAAPAEKLVNSYMVVPFVLLPLLTEDDLTAMREQFDEEANLKKKASSLKGGASAKKPAPKAVPAKKEAKKDSKKGSKKGSKKDDLTGGMSAEDKKARIELAKKKKALETTFRAEQARRAQQQEELTKLGPHVHVIDLITGDVAVVSVEFINEGGVFSEFGLLFDREKFRYRHHASDYWKDTRVPFFASAPALLYLPATGAAEEEALAKSGTANSEKRRIAKDKEVYQTRDKDSEDEDPPHTDRADPQTARKNDASPRKSSVRSRRESKKQSRPGSSLSHEGEEEEAEEPLSSREPVNSASQPIVLFLLIEALAFRGAEPDADTGKPIMPRSACQERRRKRVDELKALPEGRTLLSTHDVWSVGEGFCPESFPVSVHLEQYDWYQNKRWPVTKLHTYTRNGATAIFIARSDSPRLFRVHVRAPCGFFLSAVSHSAFLLEDCKSSSSDIFALLPSPLQMQSLSAFAQALSPVRSHASLVSAATRQTTPGSQAGGSQPGERKGDKGDRSTTALQTKLFEGAYQPQASGNLFVMLKLSFEVPHPKEGEPVRDSLLSLDLFLLDASLAPYTRLELVNNDTYESLPCVLLSLPCTRLQPNDAGYTLVASCCPPLAAYGGKWSARLVSNHTALLDSCSLDTLPKNEEFSELYKDNFALSVFRLVLTGSTGYNSHVCVQAAVASPDSGLVCTVYDVDEMSHFESSAQTPPLVQMIGLQSVFFPVLHVSKETRILVECCLDPLAKGALIEQRKPVAWKLKVWTSAGVTVALDRTQQDEFQVIKTQWEKTRPGRSKAAKVSREKFLDSKKDLMSFPKQPIVTEPTLYPAVTLTPELAQQHAQALALKLKRAAAHKEAFVQTREAEIEVSRESGETRDSGLRQTKEDLEALATEEWETRRAYRQLLLKHQELMSGLMTCITQPFVVVDEPGKKRGKADDNHGDTNTGVKAYVAGISKALDALSDIPAWKTEQLVKAAVARVQEVTILSLRIPVQQADDGKTDKKKDSIRESSVQQVKIAISLAFALPPMFHSTAVSTEIERAQGFLLSDSIRELSDELAGAEPDLSSVSEMQAAISATLAKLPNWVLEPHESETLKQAEGLLAGYARGEASGDEKSKFAKGKANTKTKKPSKQSKGSKKSGKA